MRCFLLSGQFEMHLDADQIPAKRHRLRHLDLYDVSGDELDQIERLGTSVGTDLQFATFWLPIGITTLLTLIVLTISDTRVFITYVCIMLVSLGFSIYFFVRWWITRGEFKKLINRIRERQVGPVGEEGKELKPSDLANLPSVAPNEENPQ